MRQSEKKTTSRPSDIVGRTVWDVVAAPRRLHILILLFSATLVSAIIVLYFYYSDSNQRAAIISFLTNSEIKNIELERIKKEVIEKQERITYLEGDLLEKLSEIELLKEELEEKGQSIKTLEEEIKTYRLESGESLQEKIELIGQYSSDARRTANQIYNLDLDYETCSLRIHYYSNHRVQRSGIITDYYLREGSCRNPIKLARFTEGNFLRESPLTIKAGLQGINNEPTMESCGQIDFSKDHPDGWGWESNFNWYLYFETTQEANATLEILNSLETPESCILN